MAKSSHRDLLKKAHRIVIKIGSRVLTTSRGTPNTKIFTRLAADIMHLRSSGRQVILVSSGAIAQGRKKLNLGDRKLTMPQKQAAAAAGQVALMDAYARAFKKYSQPVAQILLTHDDFQNRQRYLHSRNTLNQLLELGALPIINENDTVSVDEIMFGDNDNLSALVAGLVEADLLLMLTDIDGLCESDPADDPQAKVMPLVRDCDKEVYACAGPSHSAVGIGGMITKINAARSVASMGIPTFIGNGKVESLIPRVFEGKILGTLFLPTSKKLRGRKYWIAFVHQPKGDITIDPGACRAVTERGKSLLPSGVLSLKGRFHTGDAVRIICSDKGEVARGLVRYDAQDLKRIKGLKTSQIEQVLGEKYYDEIVHRDDMVLTADL